MIQINKSILQLKPSATLVINQKVKAMRNNNEEVFHFGFGQSPFPIHKSIVDALIKNAENNHYSPTIGLESLRKSIGIFLEKFQNISVNSDFIFIGPGSKELLFQTILILEGIFLIPKGSWDVPVLTGSVICSSLRTPTSLKLKVIKVNRNSPKTMD